MEYLITTILIPFALGYLASKLFFKILGWFIERKIKKHMSNIYKLVGEFMTPPEILAKREFEKPLIISPNNIKNFDELIGLREEIRRLELVPIKNTQIHEQYKLADKEVLFAGLTKFFETDPIFILPNEYPYWLPEDVDQYLIWVKEGTPEDEVRLFIAKSATNIGLRLSNDVILFERPVGIDSLLVRGTFPKIRHILFWIKKK